MNDSEHLLVSEYYHPDTASSGILMTELATGLHRRGIDISVLTGQPHYHGDAESQPRRSVHEGVPIKRLRTPLLRTTSGLTRAFNWILFTVWAALALLVSRAPDDRHVVVVSAPPLLSIGLWPVCRLRGWEYTYIVHDIYPENVVLLGFIRDEGVVHRVWRDLHRRSIRAADAVVVLGDEMKRRVCDLAGDDFDPDTVTVIHNWEDEEFIEPLDKSENPFSAEHDLVEPFTLLYSGNIGAWHDLETLLRAAPSFGDDVHVELIGEGDRKEYFEDLAAELDLDDTVSFLPYQPYDRLPHSLTAGDVFIVAAHEGFEGISVSSKLYSAMATGCPILCIAQPHDDIARVVEEYDAGIRVSQGDTEGIVEAVERWLDSPELVAEQGRNARRAFEEHFTREQAVDAYYRVLMDEEPPAVDGGDGEDVADADASDGGPVPSGSAS